MRLAAYVAHSVDVDAVQGQLTLEQELEWMAFDQLEPLGPRGIYLTAAHIQALKTRDAQTWQFVPWMVEEDVSEGMTSEEVTHQMQQRFGRQ